jgi:hypothetical protein
LIASAQNRRTSLLWELDGQSCCSLV